MSAATRMPRRAAKALLPKLLKLLAMLVVTLATDAVVVVDARVALINLAVARLVSKNSEDFGESYMLLSIHLT